jgi:membrane-associated phospholipid phosphatase
MKSNKLKFKSVELLTLAYILFTTVLTLVHWNGLSNPTGMLLTRAGIVAFIVIANRVHKLHPCRPLVWLRALLLLACLIIWYPETYEYCSQYPYLDHFFANLDHQLFGCQPALLFGELLSSAFWSEAFNLGYYAYYYMMVGTMSFYLFCRYDKFDKASFIFLGSFFLYYITYEFLPCAGPQYYFKAVGLEAAETGVFPEVGYYFQTNTEMIVPEIKGIFSKLVIGAQEVGERPTAAFPSSHVGMSTITMMLAWRIPNMKWRWLFWLMMPLYLLLCCATVYIKAHYLVDSIAGFFSAIALFYLTKWAYEKIKGKQGE